MNSTESQTVIDEANSEISNRVWFCEGWDKLIETKQLVMSPVEPKGWTVIGELFGNAGMVITANGFKEMQGTVRWGELTK